MWPQCHANIYLTKLMPSSYMNEHIAKPSIVWVISLGYPSQCPLLNISTLLANSMILLYNHRTGFQIHIYLLSDFLNFSSVPSTENLEGAAGCVVKYYKVQLHLERPIPKRWERHTERELYNNSIHLHYNIQPQIALIIFDWLNLTHVCQTHAKNVHLFRGRR